MLSLAAFAASFLIVLAVVVMLSGFMLGWTPHEQLEVIWGGGFLALLGSVLALFVSSGDAVETVILHYGPSVALGVITVCVFSTYVRTER